MDKVKALSVKVYIIRMRIKHKDGENVNVYKITHTNIPHCPSSSPESLYSSPLPKSASSLPEPFSLPLPLTLLDPAAPTPVPLPYPASV